ncbi:ABC transporter substrate-binding protein [soil metagenome]
MTMRAGIFLIALTVGLAAAACDAPEAVRAPASASEGRTPTASRGPGGGTFRYGIGEPTAIVPPLARTADDLAVVDAVFDSLTAWDPTGDPMSSAAVTWTATEQQDEWAFDLRPGAAFQDGTAVLASDFAAAWTLLIQEGVYGYLLADVVGYQAVSAGEQTTLSGVTVVDDHTLRVGLARSRSDFPTVVGHPALGPINVAQSEQDRDGWRDLPSGNGPFAMTEPWARGDFIRAARWDQWANGQRPPRGIDEVVFNIGDLDLNYLAFIRGRRDLTSVPPDALGLAQEQFPARGGVWDGPGLITGARPEVYLLGINPSVPPYDQVEVRQAVSLAIDRIRLSDFGQDVQLQPATALLPPPLPGTRADVCELCTFNQFGARSRLQDAGVDQLTFAFNAGGGHERIRNHLRQSLSDIGVALVSNGRGAAPSLSDYQQLLSDGSVGLFRLPLVADVPSALSVLYPLLHSDQTPENGGLNYMRYRDPTVDALLEQASRTPDKRTREALLRRVEDIALNTDHVVVPLFTYQHSVVAAERVQNLRYSPFGLVDIPQLSLTP